MACEFNGSAAFEPSVYHTNNVLINERQSGSEITGDGNSLLQMLQEAVTSQGSITLYPPSKQAVEGATGLSYQLLLHDTAVKARLLSQIVGTSRNSIILLHFDNHQDNIEWFWAATAAGVLPAISTPLASDSLQRQRHLLHLHELLHDPIILTRERLVGEFLGLEKLRIRLVESLSSQRDAANPSPSNEFGYRRDGDDVAVLMLTSGSTGHAKAVSLTNAQIRSSVRGKSQANGATSHDVFLSWIGFDHVANLLEIHLLAMSLGAEQIYVQSADLLTDPMLFLQLINTHRVSRTFAPNFLLNLLSKRLAGIESSIQKPKLDLSCLKSIVSGGESNVVQTGINLIKQLSRYQTKGEILTPAYGLTESCAAITYHPFDPAYELAEGHEISSIGTPIPGARLRIRTDTGLAAKAYEVGNLELSGPVIFKSYYNNPVATENAFTDDGWFITGDRAYVDSYGRFNLAGRSKEILIINGVKYFPQDIENALTTSHIPGIEHSYVVAFSHRPKNGQTEEFCVVYHPTFDLADAKAQSETAHFITMVASTVTGTKPYRILPLSKTQLWKSSLGKLPRTKIQREYERGSYREVESQTAHIVKSYRASCRQNPVTQTEELVLNLLCEMLDLPTDEVGINDDLFSLGITSIGLGAFVQRLRGIFVLRPEFSLIDLLSNPVIHSVARTIDKQHLHSYDPVVPLRNGGAKVPLWLMHPAAGNIFGFLPLAKCFTDRPVYALRAKGLSPGEEPFSNVIETAEIYFDHIKRVQPKGPYAIAGYSLGTTLAFEVGKLLEAHGDKVAFLGAIDSPPHTAPIVDRLDWTDAAVMVSYFFDLISEESISPITSSKKDSSRKETADYLLSIAKPSQRDALNLDREQLLRIADVTNAFGEAAKRYTPSGYVQKVDIFYCTPLKMVCPSKEIWLQNYLMAWSDFSRFAPELHECAGHHVRMLDTTYVRSFYGKLQAVLDERGL